MWRLVALRVAVGCSSCGGWLQAVAVGAKLLTPLRACGGFHDVVTVCSLFRSSFSPMDIDNQRSSSAGGWRRLSARMEDLSAAVVVVVVVYSACLLYIAKGQHKPYITHRHRR